MSGRPRRAVDAPDLELRTLLNRRRLALGLSIADIARDLDLSPGAVGHWMVGRRIPLMSEVAALAQLLGLERAELATLVRAARTYRRQLGPAKKVVVPQQQRATAPSTDHNGALLKALGDLFSDAVLILDAGGHVTYANALAETFLGTNPRDLDHREAWHRFGAMADESGMPISAERSPFAQVLLSDRDTQATHRVLHRRTDDRVETLCFVVDPVVTTARERVGLIARWRPIQPQPRGRRRSEPTE